jgi:hypothetical protein
MRADAAGETCVEFKPGKGASCARLKEVFALLKRLPEP